MIPVASCGLVSRLSHLKNSTSGRIGKHPDRPLSGSHWLSCLTPFGTKRKFYHGQDAGGWRGHKVNAFGWLDTIELDRQAYLSPDDLTSP